MSTIEVKVPDIGDFTDVPVIEIFVKPGDTVAAEDSLVSLESDKATMDVPSPAAGKVKELRVKLGDKVSEGSMLVVLEADGAGGGEARIRGSERRSAEACARGACGACGGSRSRCRAASPAAPQSRRRFPPLLRSTAKPSRARMRRRRCASSRASSVSISRASQAPGRRAASCRRTCRASSSRR